MDAVTLSEARTLKRFNKTQDRVARDFGYGETAGAIGITKDHLKPLTEYIHNRIQKLPELPEADHEKMLLRVLRNLSSETIAFSVLNSTLSAIASDENALEARQRIARSIMGEAWAAGLLEQDSVLAKRIERAVRRKHGNLQYRKQAARSIAARAGYRTKTWDRGLLLKAGNILLGYVLESLPEVFTFVKDPGNGPGWVTITPGALGLAEQAVEQALQKNPVFFPMTDAPKPWTSWLDGGYWDARSRLRVPIIRTAHKETVGAIKAALKSGTMQPHLDALNFLQGVPFKINQKVMDVIWRLYRDGVAVKGLPPKKDLPAPPKPAAWEDMDEDARRLWKYRAERVKERNRSNVSNRVLFKMDTATAKMLAKYERFYTPMNCDWRGRVYGVCHFNFQRDDRVRALFQFADGEPIGEDGLRWLKIHVANVGDFGKVSKKPLDERVKWVDMHIASIHEIAENPLANRANVDWTQADKPFLFLAACFELVEALSCGPQYVTHLPVSFDGSCSGLQHLCAMTRAEEGRLVNLTQSETPQDVYQSVADLVTARIVEDAKNPSAPNAAIAERAIAFGINRKLVKRNVMTYSYSSKKFGMGQQLVEDTMRPLAFDVLAGALKEHPFGDDEGRDAAKYLASHIYEAIEELVRRPADAMTMLQKAARALAHEGKPLTWTTPLGLPWVNRYHEPDLRKLTLWLHDTRVSMVYADGHKKEIDKDKAANGVAPNFVHALDATHLLMVAGACQRENITQLATVHDSFGCLASRATRFNQIIREQFVELYEKHDVLKEVLDQASRDLTVHNQQRLPNVPDHGSLNIREVLNADFAFA